MKRVRLISVALLTFGTGAAHAGACKALPTIELAIPDGISASRAAMLDAQRDLRKYDSLIMAYTLCLRDSGSNLRDAEAADKTLRELAARFNEQLELYKLRSIAELREQ